MAPYAHRALLVVTVAGGRRGNRKRHREENSTYEGDGRALELISLNEA